jgi:hypothetical protein
MSKLFIYCNYSILFNDNDLLVGSRWRRVAFLNRKVSINKLSLVAVQLPEKYKENLDASSEGSSSGVGY